MHSVSRFRARLARFDAHSKRGTDGSNPVPSTSESTANLSFGGEFCLEVFGAEQGWLGEAVRRARPGRRLCRREAHLPI